MTKEIQRIHLWSEEVNNVLGGGLVRGSAVLIAGDPGVGKSTLLLQLSASVAETSSSGVVYLSGEENAEQILSRVHRLGLSPKNIFLLCDTDADSALTTIMGMEFRPTLVIVDSIQMMRTQTGSGVGAAGSVTQIRDSAALFVEFAKTSGCAVMLVGHVTKSGEVAGPRVLEHLVDTVLYLEASEKGSCRLFRCIKNRFGATNEVGVLSMTPGGLVDVPNPSELFMGESVVSEGLEGCAVAVVLEGTRPLLAEIQCLVGTAKSGQLQGMPKSSRRASDGFPSQRLLLICAVIEKHIGLNLASRDIYLNVVGGLRVSEPAADLAVAVTVV
jgi:DNA repair protein RadA/Sms